MEARRFAATTVLLIVGFIGSLRCDQNSSGHHARKILGSLAYQRGNWRESIEHFSLAVGEDAAYSLEDIGIRSMMARAYFHNEETTEALKCLTALQDRYATCESVDRISSCSLRDDALFRVSEDRAWMFRSLKRYLEAVNSYEMAAKHLMLLRDQNHTLSESEKAAHKIGDMNCRDVWIVYCCARLGDTSKALSLCEKIMERCRKYGAFEPAVRSNNQLQKQRDEYVLNVFINNTMADCSENLSLRTQALEAYRGFTSTQIEEIRKAVPAEWFVTPSIVSK